MMATRYGRTGWPQSTSSKALAESQRSPPPGAPGASLEHHRGYSPRHRSSEGLPLPRPPISPTGTHRSSTAAAAPPALPPLGAGASAPAGPGPGPAPPPPAAAAAAPITSPGHAQPILPPLRSLNSPHRPSLPPPLPPPSGHQPSPLPPPSHPGHSPHLPPPPHHPYDANHPYARGGRSPSPSARPPSMGSHIPPPQQHHGPPHGPPHHGLPMQHGPPPPGYYGQPPPPGYHHPPPHVAPGMDPNAYHRMPIPAPMGVMPQHRPSKKEIKRRTKTGCLTCRKRRIKCDEGHPTCRNCEKSKRECLGYDPIFKTQSQPSTIHAAPSVPDTARPPPPAHGGGYPPNSQPYMTPPAPGYPPHMPPGQAMPPQGYGEFQGTIDPKLEQAEAPIAAPTAIEAILDVGNGRVPPTVQRTEPLSDAELDRAKEVYRLLYGAGLDKFFETTWFTARSWEHIVKNTPVVEKVALLESRFHVTAESDAEANMANQSLEGHILWDLMQLCRQVAAGVDGADTDSPDVKHGVQDTAKRIGVFEKLVTHQKLDVADIIPAPTHSGSVPGAPGLPAQLEERKNGFWHHVSTFCTLKIAEPGSSAEGATLAAIDANLNEIRQLLDSFENRDILYSIAIISHYMRPGAEPVGKPTSNSDTEDASKVTVARGFMQREAKHGTFQVAKVVCGMVLRSWKPKDN